MRTFEFLLAVGPLAIYFVVLGIINLQRRPFVLSGTREAALLGIAASGLAIIGPMELFFPRTAANQFGPYVWLLLVMFYVLLVLLWLLLARPRIVVYNISAAQLRAVLSELVYKLDAESRWAGDSVVMPKFGVQLTVESFDIMRNVSLIATGSDVTFGPWRRLERALRGELQDIVVPRNPRGYSFFIGGAMALVLVVLRAFQNSQAVANVLNELLQR